MASEFVIHKIISRGKKGKACITTMYERKSVTRHVENWIGKHPDDTLPKQYEAKRKILVEYEQTISSLETAITALQKKSPHDEQLKPLSVRLELLRLAHLEAMQSLQAFSDENPLQVRYVISEQGAGE